MVLYVGITNDLFRRVYEHKNKIIQGFTSKYNVDKLVYYEIFDSPRSAIQKEKRLKRFDRKRKLELIESVNPEWEDLYLRFL